VSPLDTVDSVALVFEIETDQWERWFPSVPSSRPGRWNKINALGRGVASRSLALRRLQEDRGFFQGELIQYLIGKMKSRP
jgi:hypothetical protein